MSTKLIRNMLIGALFVFIITNNSYAERILVEENEDIDLEDKVDELKHGIKKKLISEKIPMDLAHQDYLYRLCEERDLDYIKTLALVRHESGFNPNVNNGRNFGYMQVNKVKHEKLSKELKTANAPLNPYINLNWGTKMLEDLYRKFESEGYQGDKLDRAVWSSYNKGEYGFRRTGEAKGFIDRTYGHINWVKDKLNI